eukprot:TRINITY_DN185_c0_g1_i1.p1 TRINITY_DN185_c0_g1~~TRINITY_DN185_c0_g1_i1.p1  ORF type:complete len:218 (-),score=58.73 TRINITY_DN185_c0_g1_i1:207-827(-)
MSVQGHEWTETNLTSGAGLMLQGTLISKASQVVHVDGDGADFPTTFTTLLVKLESATKRNFDGETESVVRTNVGSAQRKGWISMDREKSKRLDELRMEEVESILSHSWNYISRNTDTNPSDGIFEFWADKRKFGISSDWHPQDQLRFKTLGDSVFIENATKVSDKHHQTMSNYTGEVEQGNSWTDRISNMEDQEASEDSSSGDWSD